MNVHITGYVYNNECGMLITRDEPIPQDNIKFSHVDLIERDNMIYVVAGYSSHENVTLMDKFLQMKG